MPPLKAGLLISFEGTEGSGKSTLVRQVASHLERRGFSTCQTREPGGSPLAEIIRKIVLNHSMSRYAELFLYEAARVEHIETLIRPSLAQGKIVLCDRFTDSSLAYQSKARGIPWKEVKVLNQIATQEIHPDLTVFLDLPPEIGLMRAQNQNRFEAEGVEFQKKVRTGFLKARKENPRRWLSIQVQNQTPEQLAEIVVLRILNRFHKRLLQGKGRG